MEGNPFITYLAGLADNENRAALASLRRGLGKEPGIAIAMYPYVVPWLPRDRHYDHWRYFLIASLFAAYPNHGAAAGNMGDTYHNIAKAQDGAGSAEKRFLSLLNSHRAQLPDHLRHAVSLAKARKVTVNYERLFYDIASWEHEEKWVQRRWAEAYWCTPKQSMEETEATEKGE